MLKKMKRIEETVGTIIDTDLTAAFIWTDVIAMLCTTGLIAIMSKIVEFLIGTPNWPEVVIAWLFVYLAIAFPIVMYCWEVAVEMGERNHKILDELKDAEVEVETRDL